MMDLFLTNMQLLPSQDGNWWSGVDYFWIIVMFFYQLFGLSFWRHPRGVWYDDFWSWTIKMSPRSAFEEIL